MSKALKRCHWVTDDQIYIDYHDKEWGVPVHDDQKLFEMLILEGAQAGLSWITILKRRDAYKIAYDNFDPVIMANWDENKVSSLLSDASIIRNKLKIGSASKNARAYLQVVEEFGSFDSYIWSFVGGKVKTNAWQLPEQIPASSKESKAMSKDLKKRGFSFVGPTICYAYMQSVGMVNDHLSTCFRYDQVYLNP